MLNKQTKNKDNKMIFSNITLFSFTKSSFIQKLETSEGLAQLKSAIQDNLFKSCDSTYSLSSLGFEEIKESEDENAQSVPFLTFPQGVLICCKSEKKLLPSSVVKEEIEKRVEELQEKGEKISRATRATIKDQVIQTLSAQAFSKYEYNYIFIDFKTQLLYINAPLNKAERLTALLRKAYGTLPVLPTLFNVDLTELFKNYYQVESDDLVLFNDFKSKNKNNLSNVVTFKNEEDFYLEQLDDRDIVEINLSLSETHSVIKLTTNAVLSKIKMDKALFQINKDGDLTFLDFQGSALIEIGEIRDILSQLSRLFGIKEFKENSED